MVYRNAISHFELPADDLNRAKAFYEKAFGWSMVPMPGMDYVMIGTVPTDDTQTPKEPGAINGGLARRGGPLKNVTVVASVPSIDAALKKIESSGGKVVEPKRAVADMGFVAYFKDTEGNVVGLWQDAAR